MLATEALHQARRRKKTFDTARDVLQGRMQVGDWSSGAESKLPPYRAQGRTSMKQSQGRARAQGWSATPQDTVRSNSRTRLATARSDSKWKAPPRVGIRRVAGRLDVAPEPADLRAHSVGKGSLEERSEVVIMGSTLFCSADLRHVVANGKEPAPMEAKATARMT